MEPVDVTLSGELLVAPHVWQLIYPLARRNDAGGGPVPREGDLQLQATLRRSLYASPESPDRCRGEVALTVYNSVCWCKFELSGFTCLRLFENVSQLEGIERWVRKCVADSAGHTCRALPRKDGRIIYELVQQTAAVR